MDALYWAKESNENGKDGVLVRYPFKGIALTMAEQVADDKKRMLLEQWPSGITRDGGLHWFFEYQH